MTKDRQKQAGEMVEIRQFLEGLDYPVRKNDIFTSAREEGVPEKIVSTIESLPNTIYDSAEAVYEALFVSPVHLS